MPPLAKSLFYSCSADTCLARAGWVYFNDYPRSLFRFRAQFIDKARPSCVVDLFRKIRPRKATDIQILDGDKPEVVHDNSAQFVVKVAALVPNMAVNAPKRRNGLLSSPAPFAPSRNLSCGDAELPLRRLVIARILNCASIGEGGECRYSNVNAGSNVARRQRHNVTLNSQQGEPASRLSFYSKSLDRPDNGTVRFNSHLADLWKPDLIAVKRLTDLTESYAVVSLERSETGIAYPASLYPPKERLERKMNTFKRVLKNERANRCYVLAQYADLRKLKILIEPRDEFTLTLPCVAPLLKRCVIYLAANCQVLNESALLRFSRVDPVSEYLDQRGPILPQEEKETR